MRNIWASATLGVVTILVLAGCTGEAQTDGFVETAVNTPTGTSTPTETPTPPPTPSDSPEPSPTQTPLEVDN